MIDVTIPRPVQLVIDDVGWREGWDISESGGPFRAGVERLLGPDDYAAVAELGAALDIRPQCALVLCEWDKTNACARVPTATPQGAAWDNSPRVGDWSERAAGVFIKRAAHIELAMHGVGHEHWEDGVRTRAEWHGADAGQRWPPAVLQAHADCFRTILGQYGLDPEHGISYPQSFVPCAFRYYWDPADPESTGAFMRRCGIRFASTPFRSCCFSGRPPERHDGGFEHGLLLLDRGNSGVPWHVYATTPKELPDNSICGIHWPNLLSSDPATNNAPVRIWTQYLDRIRQRPGYLLARSMAETCSQWLYHSFVTLAADGANAVLVDTRAIPAVAREQDLLLPMVVEVRGRNDPSATLRTEGCRVVSFWREGEREFHGLKPDSGCRCRIELGPGRAAASPVVLRTGTYDLIDLQPTADSVRVELRMYGTQQVTLRLPFTPGCVQTDTPGLCLGQMTWDPVEHQASVSCSGRDIQGHRGALVFHR